MSINDRFAPLDLNDITVTAEQLNTAGGGAAGGAAGVATASKAVVLDANKAVDEVNTAKLSIGATGSEVEVTATPAEINRINDKSASVVDESTAATLAVTEAAHGDRTILIGKTDGQIVTLPAATGTGNKYTFIIAVAAGSNANIIKVANATDVFDGSQAIGRDADAEGATGYVWGAETNDDTLTMDGTAKGGKVGDRIEVIDYKAGFFSVIAHLNQSGGSEVTPFSATVA